MQNTNQLSIDFDGDHIRRCEDLPTEPAPGNYVIIDVMFFSTTVVELLAAGAQSVHVPEERGLEFEYQSDNADAKIGGGRTEAFEPEDGYDFFNSPSYVQSVDVTGRPTSLTSSNGGRAISNLQELGGDDVDVYIGSTTNAAELARHLPDDEETYLVSAGSKGEWATEDDLGAAMIGRYLNDYPLLDFEVEMFQDMLQVAKGENYVERHEIRRRDVEEFVQAMNSRSVVPKLVGGEFVDVSESPLQTAAQPATSD